MAIETFDFRKGQILDLLFKKVSANITKTDTEIAKSPANEVDASPYQINPDFILYEDIPGTPPGSSTSVVQVINDLATTEDPTSEPRRTWKTGQVNWIPPTYGSLYLVEVKAGTTVLNINGSGNNDQWYFDYSSGVLHFIGENLPTEVLSNDITISDYRYIGKTIKDELDDVKNDITSIETDINALKIPDVYTQEGNSTVQGNIKIYSFSKLSNQDDWSFDISAAGFSGIFGIYAQAFNSSGNAISDTAIATIQTFSTTQVTGRIVTGNVIVTLLLGGGQGLQFIDEDVIVSLLVIGQ